MEFALSDDQRMLQESVSGTLEARAPLDEVRKAADGDRTAADAIEAAFGSLGVGAMLVPESHGGLGLGLLDAALVQEALGHAVTPARFMAGSVMAVTALTQGGTQAQQAEWLPKIASGEIRFGAALAEHAGARDKAGIMAQKGLLFGRSLFAMETAGATHYLVTDDDGRLHVVEADAKGVTRTPLTLIDKTRDFAELRFDGVQALDMVSAPAADRAVEAGRLMLAADTLGAADAMIHKAVAYAQERKQFNRVIGSFQAVKHLCAEMAAELEPARALVWHAAHAVDEDMDEARLMVCLAKSHLAEIGTFIARTSVEVHGGMGFTDLVGLHYWFKRIGTNRQLLGGPELVREDAARIQGWVA